MHVVFSPVPYPSALGSRLGQTPSVCPVTQLVQDGTQDDVVFVAQPQNLTYSIMTKKRYQLDDTTQHRRLLCFFFVFGDVCHPCQRDSICHLPSEHLSQFMSTLSHACICHHMICHQSHCILKQQETAKVRIRHSNNKSIICL